MKFDNFLAIYMFCQTEALLHHLDHYINLIEIANYTGISLWGSELNFEHLKQDQGFIDILFA